MSKIAKECKNVRKITTDEIIKENEFLKEVTEELYILKLLHGSK